MKRFSFNQQVSNIMAKSKYDTAPDADTTSAGITTHAKRSASVIDTVTESEAAALAVDGISCKRFLTAYTAHDIKSMRSEALRDLAASLGKTGDGETAVWNCSPNGKLGGVFSRIMDYRRAESRALGHASRRIQNMRTAALNDV